MEYETRILLFSLHQHFPEDEIIKLTPGFQIAGSILDPFCGWQNTWICFDIKFLNKTIIAPFFLLLAKSNEETYRQAFHFIAV